MSTKEKFPRVDVNVVNILNSVAMVGMYRGKEVWAEIEKRMDEALDNTLVTIDIRQANPLQYEFCQYAFGPLLGSLNNGRWPHKHVIFQMHDFHKPGFFRGVLKNLGKELPRKESETGFVAAGFYAKLIVGNKRLLSFVGKLSRDQERTLHVVNELKEVTAVQVSEKLDLPVEDIIDTLRDLIKKYFVIGPRESQTVGTPRYYSLYKYFEKG